MFGGGWDKFCVAMGGAFGFLPPPPFTPSVATFSDIQRNLHGACLADAAGVRSS